MMEQWEYRLKEIFELYDNDNPTTASLLFMLNNMIEELKAYKEIGTVDEFSRLKYS